MLYLVCTFAFAAFYAVKGGWHGPLRLKYARAVGIEIGADNKPIFTRKRDYWLYQVMDGKVLSTVGVFLFMAVALSTRLHGLTEYGVPVYKLAVTMPFWFALAWIAGVSPSMGEEAGAVGRLGRSWGDYIDKGFGRPYGLKKAIQRGVFMGALFTLVTGYTPFIVAGSLFPAVHWIGQTAYYLVHKTDSWKYAEPLMGAVIGLAVAGYLN